MTTCCDYWDWLPGWAQSVAALDTRPDDVVIVAGDPARAVGATATHLSHARVVAAPSGEFQFASWLNAGVEACAADWVAWIGVDDRYRPTALDGLDDMPADVAVFGMRAGTWDSTTAPTIRELTAIDSNSVPCGSPFRRWLWERTPFQPHLAPFEDWAFYVGAAFNGGRFAPTGRIDFDYRMHDDTYTAMEPTRTRIREWAARTWEAQ